MALDLTMSGAGYDTSTPKFPPAALNAGYGETVNQTFGSAWAFECWTYNGSNPSATRVAMGSNLKGYLGSDPAGDLTFQYRAPGGSIITITAGGTASTIFDGNKHHIVGQVGASGGMLFLDGTLVGSNAATYEDNGNAPIGVRDHGGFASFPWPGSIDEAVYWVAEKYTAAGFSVPTSPYFGNEADMGALWHLDNNGTDSKIAAPLVILPNDAAFLYSPYNWNVGAGSAVSLNGGAYFRVRFTGTTCILFFDISYMTVVVSQIWWRIDGGDWTREDVAASVTCAIPSTTTAAANHLLEVRIAATTEFQVPGGQSGNRWNPASSPCTAVVFTGLGLATSQSVSAVTPADKTVLIYGDSITEGYLTLNNTGANDVVRSDNTLSWAFLQKDLLGAEVGVVGFGGQGLSTNGVGGVPTFGNTYNYIYSGQARSFADEPDMIVINQGENDGTNNIVAAYTSVLNALLAACPTAPIACLRPFSGREAANIQAAIAACNAPSRVTYIDTTGFFNTADSPDGQHPNVIANMGRIAPLVAAQLKPILYPGGSISIWDGAGRIWT